MLKLEKKIQERIDGLEFSLINGNNVRIDFEGGVLEIKVDGKKIFMERIPSPPFFTTNLVQEISHLLNHHSSCGDDPLEEIDFKCYEILKDLDDENPENWPK